MLEIKALHRWFFENRRSFPWREKSDPYCVWISEIMLQQTRASVVEPYFVAWMRRFPSIDVLAQAPIEEVIKAWEGLGYYSRARNIHEAAKEIVAKHKGQIPEDPRDLLNIKGIGSYTRGAILSFGFHKKAAAVDGNVLRLLSRLFLIEKNIDQMGTRKEIEAFTEEILDEKTPWITMEALIEFGAMVCTPAPKCEKCIFQKNCQAKNRGKERALPIKNEKGSLEKLFRIVPILLFEDQILVQKGKKGKVMADLYQFPFFEQPSSEVSFFTAKELVKKKFALEVSFLKKLKSVSHTFTRFKAHLFPFLMKVELKKEIEDFEWLFLKELALKPFASGHRNLVGLLGEI